MLSNASLLRPERAAHATIRGYLYQACLGVQRWLELGPEEVLLCEGDEDLDRRILGGGGLSEQVKVSSDSLGLSDRVVRESLRNFLVSYVALREQGETRRFRFTTTAPARRAHGFDLLPDLAMSLNNLGSDLSQFGRHKEALSVKKEAIRIFSPFFVRYPDAFFSVMEICVRTYLGLLGKLDPKPDEQLLSPILDLLSERLPPPDSTSSD